MDQVDRAQIEIERQLEQALADCCTSPTPAQEPTKGCIRCGGEIAQGRLILGYATCIDCAAWFDRQAQQRATR